LAFATTTQTLPVSQNQCEPAGAGDVGAAAQTPVWRSCGWLWTTKRS